MSRYSIPANDPRYRCTVGWDNPLETFFAQVEDREAEDDSEEQVVLWRGALPTDKILTVESLAEAIKDYGVIPEHTATKLRLDYENRRPPSPLQQHLRSIFGG